MKTLYYNLMKNVKNKVYRHELTGRTYEIKDLKRDLRNWKLECIDTETKKTSNFDLEVIKHMKVLEEGLSEYEMEERGFERTGEPNSSGLYKMYKIEEVKGNKEQLTIFQQREDGLYYYSKTKNFE